MFRIWRRAAGCLLVAVAATWATAGLADYEDGLYAFDRGDYPRALAEWQIAAAAADAQAQYRLAGLYERGQGTARNLAEAYAWYHVAAANGHSDAAVAKARIAPELDHDQTFVALELVKQRRAMISADAALARRVVGRGRWVGFAYGGSAISQTGDPIDCEASIGVLWEVDGRNVVGTARMGNRDYSLAGTVEDEGGTRVLRAQSTADGSNQPQISIEAQLSILTAIGELRASNISVATQEGMERVTCGGRMTAAAVNDPRQKAWQDANSYFATAEMNDPDCRAFAGLHDKNAAIAAGAVGFGILGGILATSIVENSNRNRRYLYLACLADRHIIADAGFTEANASAAAESGKTTETTKKAAPAEPYEPVTVIQLGKKDDKKSTAKRDGSKQQVFFLNADGGEERPMKTDLDGRWVGKGKITSGLYDAGQASDPWVAYCGNLAIDMRVEEGELHGSIATTASNRHKFKLTGFVHADGTLVNAMADGAYDIYLRGSLSRGKWTLESCSGTYTLAKAE